MKNVIFGIILTLSLSAIACTNESQQSQANAASKQQTANNAPLVASGHGPQSAQSNQAAQSNLPNASSSANDSAAPPMMTGNATAIDTSEFDGKIAKAEKESKQKPKDETVKKALGDAYAERAFALTEAAQYRSALGDFRRALKLDPNNSEAKQMHDQIVKIFKDLNREPPKEGEEPSPLPFKKA